MHFQSYNEHLKHLSHSITEMGGLVKEMITCAYESLSAKDDAHKEHIKWMDKKVNALDHNINEQAVAVLMMRSPMGNDLRFVTSSLGIASDLERAGDLAKNITKRSLKIGEYTPASVLGLLESMVNNITQMLCDGITAVETRNSDLALEVWRKDKEVDKLYNEILKMLRSELQTRPDEIEAITHFMFASKNFERIADYTTSLARTVYYVTTGKQATKEVLKSKSEY